MSGFTVVELLNGQYVKSENCYRNQVLVIRQAGHIQ